MKYRTIFISDTHLGFPSARADLLLDFLDKNNANTMYLVGDIIDIWALKRKPYWPPIYNQLLERIQFEIKTGTRVFYLPGNHDTFLRNIKGRFAGIDFVDSIVHTTRTGRRFLVLHGDQLDYVATHIRWLSHIGDRAYDYAVGFSAWLTKIRTRLGYPHWSFSQWAKASIKGSVAFLEGYESLLKHEAKKHGCDGVICGHIHTANLKEENGFTYVNCGDWVESFTAVVETNDGSFEIVRWGNR